MNNEEPKQIKCYCGHTTMCDCSPKYEPKQETLEEIAVNCWAEGDWDNRDSFTDGFVEGAKWQQERTEKEMQSAWEDGRNNVITVGKPPFVITKFQHNSFSNWFEKFKKK